MDHQPLPFLELADEFAARFIIGHAAVVEANDIRTCHRLSAVHDYACAGLDRHAERQRDAKQLLGIVVRLDQDGCDNRHARFHAAVLTGEAYLLGVCFLTLETELGPGREDQLRLLAGLCLRLTRCLRLRSLRRFCRGGLRSGFRCRLRLRRRCCWCAKRSSHRGAGSAGRRSGVPWPAQHGRPVRPGAEGPSAQ